VVLTPSSFSSTSIKLLFFQIDRVYHLIYKTPFILLVIYSKTCIIETKFIKGRILTTYETNIQALASVNPNLAQRVFDITENTRFEVFQGKDLADINMYDLEKSLPMYDNPIQDVIDFSDKSVIYATYPFRYFYGVGNGISISMALKVPALRRVVVFEPNIELLYIVFNLIDFAEALRTKKLVFQLTQDLDFDTAYQYFSDKESQLYARLFNLEILSKYYDISDFQTCSLTLSTLTQALNHIITVHGNDAQDALMGIENHLVNLPDMIKGPKFVNLFGKAEGKTAIITSTGPSLTKQLPLLKKIKDHVTIICPDASLPILEKHGIKPDYVTVIERIALTAEFLKNTSTEFQKDINFVCASLIHQEVKDAIKEGTLYLEMRPHGYTKFFDLDDFGYLGQGLSTANLAYELAIVLEFDNVIFIGQDLAYGKDNTSHATDHTFSANEKDVDSEKERYTIAYGGEGTIRTTMIWDLFRNHFESLIAQTKTFLKSINATEGGARIEGSIEMSFEEAIKTYVDLDFNKKLVQPVYPTSAEHKKYTTRLLSKTNHLFKEAIEKQEIIEEIFLKVQEYSETLVELTQNNQLDEIDYDYLQGLSDEIDKIKHFTQDDTFNLMFFDTIRSYLVHQELELAALHVQPAHTDSEKKIKLIDWVMKHRYWLFSLAGGIDAQRTIMQRAIETWPSELKDQLNIPIKKELEYDQEKYNRLKQQAEQEQDEKTTKAKAGLDNVLKQLEEQGK